MFLSEIGVVDGVASSLGGVLAIDGSRFKIISDVDVAKTCGEICSSWKYLVGSNFALVIVLDWVGVGVGVGA